MLGFAVAEDVERLAGFEGAEEGDQSAVGDALLVADVLDELFLVAFGLQVSDGAALVIGSLADVVSPSFGGVFRGVEKVLEQDASGVEPSRVAGQMGEHA